MDRALKIVGCITALAVLWMTAPLALAYPEAGRQTKASCSACHADPCGGAALTAAGKAYKAEGKAPAAAAQSPEYVGSAKCRMCHLKQHKAWSATKHAAAFASLEKVDAKAAAEMAAKLKIELKGSAAKTDACVTCHVTGFRLAGGYPHADPAKNAALAAVTCESCHGPGGKHVTSAAADKKKTIQSAVGAGTCKGCHTPVLSPDFDFAKRKATVHPVAAAK